MSWGPPVPPAGVASQFLCFHVVLETGRSYITGSLGSVAGATFEDIYAGSSGAHASVDDWKCWTTAGKETS